MRFFRSFFFTLSFALPAYGQANQGELQLNVVDPSGATAKASVRIVSEANQYAATLTTDTDGRLVARHLPFGLYGVEIHQPGFEDASESIDINSAIPARRTIQLKLSSVQQSVTISANDTLLDTDQPGSVNQVGSALIQNRLGSVPGRSIQDLVNSQPGWLYEGNAVLHPRGSEYQTQFVIDGIPLTDNRSPSFGPEMEADDVESMSIYTAGIPAEYGRKMGGVVEINTQQDSEPGFHGQVSLYGGSFTSAGAFAKGQYSWGKNVLGASGAGSRTDHYLNPVVPENYSNTGTLGDFSVDYRRELTSSDKVAMSVRHEIARYDIPNELIQQAAGQRQNADNIETMGIVSYQHFFSANAVGDLHGMVRDNSNNFYSNPESTPVEVFQNNSFRDGYFKAGFTFNRGRQEWRIGVESDNAFLHENTNYNITDPSRYDDDTLPTFASQGERPDLEQAVFVQDLIHLSHWTISAGLRWDHYQLLLNKQAVQPRFSVARYFDSLNTVVHFSYDRIFQTPSFENLLLSSSDAVKAISSDFLRLPVEPSQGDYYELGLTSVFAKHLKLNANYFRRFVNEFADDDQIDNTSISFPISFREAIIYGAEGKIEVPEWHHFSGLATYSYEVGNVWNPVTGGLFLGQNASDAASNLSGHFPASQDQRNTIRGRVRCQATSRTWFAGGVQYDTGLPFEFRGSVEDASAQYGQQVIDRVNFDRGRILPSFQVNASAGIDIYRGERMKMRLQADGQNLTDVLNVIDFAGLFSGNAIGPSRSFWLRLTGNF
jgi:TonB-dependent Receptor Plug Domain